MLGFIARRGPAASRGRDDELEDARWFDRAEVAEAAAGRGDAAAAAAAGDRAAADRGGWLAGC